MHVIDTVRCAHSLGVGDLDGDGETEIVAASTTHSGPTGTAAALLYKKADASREYIQRCGSTTVSSTTTAPKIWSSWLPVRPVILSHGWQDRDLRPSLGVLSLTSSGMLALFGSGSRKSAPLPVRAALLRMHLATGQSGPAHEGEIPMPANGLGYQDHPLSEDEVREIFTRAIDSAALRGRKSSASCRTARAPVRCRSCSG